jgi:hypothetical protein
MLFFMAFIFLFAISLFGQEVLPGYNGFFDRNTYIWAPDLVEFYPYRLDVLRNEIYARYGRPFKNKKYKDYFSAQKWYREKQEFSESWLTKQDREYVALISSIERTPHCFSAIADARKNKIVYTGPHDIHFPSFTAQTAAIGYNSEFTDEYIEENYPWTVIGNWLLIYEYLKGDGTYYRNRYQVWSYEIDTDTKKVVQLGYSSNVEKDIFESFLSFQNIIKLQYTSNW